MGDSAEDIAENFISRWKGVTASELSTAQSFVADLCRLLGVDVPHPDAEQQYMFERPITFAHGDGSTSAGRIDLYRRGAFVLEAKKLKAATHTKGFDDAMLRARSQAEQYARALPANEGRPPFLIVVDVGNRIELYSEFSRSGATYTPFPDPRSYRIALDDLRDESIRDRLRQIWSDPLSLDPSRASARVTREIAARLATLARSLEQAGHCAETVAQFLMRCLFTMFAEDVRLLPADSFLNLLVKYVAQPDVAMRMLAQLWRDMDSGGFSAAIAGDVLRFNGKLFKHPETLPLDRKQIELLIDAAKKRWEQVEPAIFGTLLERALDPDERHKLGAHYTPRAYVERLVLPTVIEPLRVEWNNAHAAALTQLQIAAQMRPDGSASIKVQSQTERFKQYQIELRKALDIILAFHKRLCGVRILDPACGSGNFLYVTLEHLKRLEGEVLNTLEEYGLTRLGVGAQTELDIATTRAISTMAETVDPHQLLGIELNPRAAAIAEVVLWIGYLQWHYRTRGDVNPPQPVIRDFRNIENRDAVLAYGSVEFVADEHGVPVTRWDGKTFKISPVTGEEIPDDGARISVERYLNPRKAAWPEADFVVGNPPFIGNKRMRSALGDGYVDALRATCENVPDTADFVMYWWDHAAELLRNNKLRSFGLITTNSLRQTFNRQITARHLDAEKPLSLRFVVPDHPWIDSGQGAAVRIAISVADMQPHPGKFSEVTKETVGANGEIDVVLVSRQGQIHADLTVGAKVASAVKLKANTNVCFQGMNLVGKGFRLTSSEVGELGYDLTHLPDVIKPHCNARDLMQSDEHSYVIDFFGISAEKARQQYPALYQHLYDRVKPERDHNNRESRRRNWWLFGETVGKLRKAWDTIERVILTPETSKHRVFTFVNRPFCPDHKLYVICLSDTFAFGVLSSEIHATWALQAGGRLGVGNDPTWTNTTCFATFPFPLANQEQRTRICDLGEQLDGHRKRQQAMHPNLTLTGMYNVLAKLRSGESLTQRERAIHEYGLVSVLRQLHDELDIAVLEAYDWTDLIPVLRVANSNQAPFDSLVTEIPFVATRDPARGALDAELLERLVALNAARAAEEARGLVRWLRPDFQNPSEQITPQQVEIETNAHEPATTKSIAAAKPISWPKDAVDQVRAVADVLASSAQSLTVEDIAARFTSRGAWKKRLPPLLEMLVALGRAQESRGQYWTLK